MASVALATTPSPMRNFPPDMSPSQHRQIEVIELSSDDNSTQMTPPRNRQSIHSGSLTRKPRRRTAMLDSDGDEHHSVVGHDFNAFEPPERQVKRPKLRHELPGRLERSVNDFDSVNPLQSFPQLEFQTPPDPSPTSALTNSDHHLPEPQSLLPIQQILPGHTIAVPPDTPLQPPYYYDSNFQVEMYRGRGYEKFPIAFETLKDHEQIRRNWEDKFARKSGIIPARDQRNSSTIIKNESSPPASEIDRKCLKRILEVLPDIEHSFALDRVKAFTLHQQCVGADFDEGEVSTLIISQLLEEGDYPRLRLLKPFDNRKESALDDTGTTIEYDKFIMKDPSYLKDAVSLLAAEFKYVPTKYINAVVLEKRSVSEAYVSLRETEDNYYKLQRPPYSRHRQPRKELEKKYAQRRAGEQRIHGKYLHMVNELQAAKQQAAREDLKLDKQKRHEEIETANLQTHRASGSLVQCQCCFDDEIPMNRTVSCDGDKVHFYCYSCISNHAETQVGLMRHEMKCMDTEGCTADLILQEIARAVPLKVFDRLAFNKQQAEISAAGIEGLEQCPFCDFKAICEPIEYDCVFNCQNPDCGRATCRRCKEDAHVPKSCEENKNDRGLSARHVVEEARTDAVTRACPKCGVKIIKEMGCNKMVCTQCRTLICYVCKANISDPREGGYHHFNRPGATCRLHDDHGVDRHEREADEAEEKAIKKVKADNAELDEKELQIETGAARKKNKASVNPLAHFLPPINPDPFPFGMPGVFRNDLGPPQNLLGLDRLIAEDGYRFYGRQAGYAAARAHQTYLPQVEPLPPAFQDFDPLVNLRNAENVPFGEMLRGRDLDFRPPPLAHLPYGYNQRHRALNEPNLAGLRENGERRYERQQVDEWMMGIPADNL